jgi:translocation and assembly module TamB
MGQTPQTAAAAPRRRHAWLRVLAGAFVAFLLLLGGGVWYISTPRFANKVRLKVIAELEQATGGRVDLQRFQWNIRHLAFEADDLTIHGLEAPNEIPYAHVDRLYLQLKILALIHPRAGVNLLELDHPVIHLIVYPDGSTNQPRPRTPSGNPRDTINTIFDLQAGRVSAWNGVLLFNQRSAPFSFSGRDLSLLVQYVTTSDTYSAHLKLGDITTSLMKEPEVHSQLTGELQLGRNLAQINSLEWKTLRSGLTITGKVQNYLAPVIDFQAHGKADLRDIAYMADVYQLAGGVARLDMQAHGSSLDDMLATGKVSVTGGAYKDPYFQIRNVSLETPFRFTGKVIQASDVHALAAGGLILHGAFTLTNWLNQAAALDGKKFPAAEEPHAEFGADLKAIVLPDVLRSALSPKYSDLGFNTAINGRGDGGWRGDPRGVFVSAKIDLTPLQAPDGVPVSGAVDATYTGTNDLVDVRTLDVQTPASSLQAEGKLDVGIHNSHTQLRADLTTTNLAEFNHVLAMVGIGANTANPSQALPVQLHGEAAFHGQVEGPLELLRVSGHLDATNFSTVLPAQPVSAGQPAPPQRTLSWDSLHTDFDVSPESLSFANLALAKGSTLLHAGATLVATDKNHGAYVFNKDTTVNGTASVKGAAITDLEAIAGQTNLPVTGTLSLNARVTGQVDNLQGDGHISVIGGTIYNEPYKSLSADLVASHSDIGVANLVFSQNGGHITGNGGFDFEAHTLHADVTGSGFELAHIQQLQRGPKPLGGALNFHLIASGALASPSLNGNLDLKNATLGKQPLGELTARVHTQNHVAYLDASSNLLQSNVQLHGSVAMGGNYQIQATATLGNLDAQPLLAIFAPQASALHTSIEGGLKIEGPLKLPKQLDVQAALSTFQLKYDTFTLNNQGPLQASVTHGLLKIDAFHITGPETDLTAHGSANIFGDRALNMQVKGAVNLAIAKSFNRDIVSSGHVDLALDAGGNLDSPQLRGKVTIANGEIADIDFPNGLSKLNGTLEFNEDRLEVRKLTAITGGGDVSVGGFLTYEHGFYADLTAKATDVRVRYPAGISSTANATLHLLGSPQQSTLSGNVLLTRFGITGNLGLGSGAAGPIAAPPDPNSPTSHILLDVHLTSAPELNFENSYATLAGQVDLRIRGSVAAPSVLGKVLITQGSAELAGTQYQLQRGQIYFSNPVRIDPIIDLDATASVRDYDISLGVHGTIEKLNTTYRSEPPLPQSDIIALLALGRTQEEAQIYQQEQSDAGVNSTTNALLGGALNATVSNRVQKLFGVGQVKIDPNFVGSLGQSTARVTVTQQVTKAVTLTYATNVNETSQQLIQATFAINRNVSLVAVRDEAGVFSLLVHIRQRKR